MKLRPYQSKGIELTRKAFRDKNRKILFWLATGGGKSAISITFIRNLLRKGKKVCFVVRRKQLVVDAYKKFKAQGIDCSILMGNDKRFDKHKQLQICSIDTVSRRDITFMVGCYATVIDECHDATSKTYSKFLEDIKSALYFGLTATPFDVGNKVHAFWDCVVKPVEMHELRDMGYLTDAEIFIPSEVDLDDISNVGGDYHKGQLSSRMTELKVIGDMVQNYKDYGGGKVGVVFATDKKASMMYRDSFLEAGIEAHHIDDSTKQADRDKAIARIKECAVIGKPCLICNVDIIGTGVDIPELEVIFTRPTRSEILYLQHIGRVLRPYRRCGRCKQAYDNSDKCYHCGYDKPEYIKEYARIIDNGNNIERHGHPFKVRHAVLSKEDKKAKKEIEKNEFKTKKCKGCFRTFEAYHRHCPYCDYRNEKVQRSIKRVDGKLVPYDQFEFMKRRLAYYQRVKLERSLKSNFPYFKMYEQFGDEVYQYKELKIPAWIGRTFKKKLENEKIYS